MQICLVELLILGADSGGSVTDSNTAGEAANVDRVAIDGGPEVDQKPLPMRPHEHGVMLVQRRKGWQRVRGDVKRRQVLPLQWHIRVHPEELPGRRVCEIGRSRGEARTRMSARCMRLRQSEQRPHAQRASWVGVGL